MLLFITHAQQMGFTIFTRFSSNLVARGFLSRDPTLLLLQNFNTFPGLFQDPDYSSRMICNPAVLN